MFFLPYFSTVQILLFIAYCHVVQLTHFPFLLLQLDAIPCWLGGTIAIFIAFWALALGLWGLFAWPRRHAILTTIIALALMAFIIVNIILAATRIGTCLPKWNSGENIFFYNGATNAFSSSPGSGFVQLPWTQWCGSRIAVYVTHGILLGLFVSKKYL